MGKKALEPITESMFYVLMCLHNRNMYRTEIADLVRKITEDRVKLGPGTLYAILSTFETEKGEKLYQNELQRLRKCLWDSQRDLSMQEEDKTAFASDSQGNVGEFATV